MTTEASPSPRFDFESAVRGARAVARSATPAWSSVQRRLTRDRRLFVAAMVLASMLVALAVWECVMLHQAYHHPGNALDRLLDGYLPRRSHSPRGSAYLPVLKSWPRAVWRHGVGVFFPLFALLAIARRETAAFVLAAGLTLMSWQVIGWWIFPVLNENGTPMGSLPTTQLWSFGLDPAWWVVSHTGRSLVELALSGALVVVLARLTARDDGGPFTPLRYRCCLLGSAVAFAFGFGVHLKSVARWLTTLQDSYYPDLVAMFDFMMLDLLPMLLCAVTFIGVMRLRTWSLLTGILACVAALVLPVVLPLVSYAYVDADYFLPPFANWALLVALAPLAWTFLDALRSGRDLAFDPVTPPGSD